MMTVTTQPEGSHLLTNHRPETGLPPQGIVGVNFGGVLVTRSLFSAYTKELMLQEAHRSWNEAELQDTAFDDHADGRGGQPARRLWSGPGGPDQDQGYNDLDVSRKLSAVTGWPIRPAGSRGSYSYYTDNDQFLGLHRDVVTCDITTITVLADNSNERDPHGGLLCYPGRCNEPLSGIRADSDTGSCVLKAPAGSTIVVAGGEVAHRLLPVAQGTTRVISVLCFEAVSAAGCC